MTVLEYLTLGTDDVDEIFKATDSTLAGEEFDLEEAFEQLARMKAPEKAMNPLEASGGYAPKEPSQLRNPVAL
jgi:hypothetical protein